VVHSEKKEVVFEFQRMGVSAARVRERALRNYLGRALWVRGIIQSYSRQSRPWIGPHSLKTNNARGHQLWERTFQARYAPGKRLSLCLAPTIHCKMPSTVGRDFAGEVCTGTPLQMAQSYAVLNGWEKQQHRAGTPDELIANQVVIQLDLRLIQTDSVLSGSAGQ